METLPGSSISKSTPQEITFSSHFCVDFRASCLYSLSPAQLCRWRHWGDGMAWDCEEQFSVFCMHFCIPIKRIVYSHSLSFRSELLHCNIAQQHCSLLSCNLNPKPSNHVNLVGHVGDWLLYISSSHLSLANSQHIILIRRIEKVTVHQKLWIFPQTKWLPTMLLICLPIFTAERSLLQLQNGHSANIGKKCEISSGSSTCGRAFCFCVQLFEELYSYDAHEADAVASVCVCSWSFFYNSLLGAVQSFDSGTVVVKTRLLLINVQRYLGNSWHQQSGSNQRSTMVEPWFSSLEALQLFWKLQNCFCLVPSLMLLHDGVAKSEVIFIF